ncbi:hypothetical protein DdX_19608 [Ditylenchus destructor]|uniref:Uncharacterized protein n=1 Tax=Ditylenchus destructor TaxID=166010 RepID=A0AAD4MJE4_9BILA|nr:hypothetical protein DdX_19608 [Ditylenchus destructor]
MTSREYLSYLNYCETIVTVSLQIVSIILMSNLLYCSLTKSRIFVVRSKLSKSLLFYLFGHVTFSSLFLVYNFYLLIFWRPHGMPEAFTPMGLFWTGLTCVYFVIVGPVLVLQLTVDRSLTLALGHRYSTLAQRSMMGLALLIMFITSIGVTIVAILELPLEMEKGKKRNVTPIGERASPSLGAA